MKKSLLLERRGAPYLATTALSTIARQMRTAALVLCVLIIPALGAFSRFATISVPDFNFPVFSGNSFIANHTKGEIGSAVLTGYLCTYAEGKVAMYLPLEEYTAYFVKLRGISSKLNRIHGIDGILVPLKDNPHSTGYTVAHTETSPIIAIEAKYKTHTGPWTGSAPLYGKQMSYSWLKYCVAGVRANCEKRLQEDLARVTTPDPSRRLAERNFIKNVYHELFTKILDHIPDESLSIVGVFCPPVHLTLYTPSESRYVAENIIDHCYSSTLPYDKESESLNRFYEVIFESIGRAMKSALGFEKQKTRDGIIDLLTEVIDAVKAS